MNTIEVICGILIKNNAVLVAQRNFNMSLPFKWEFPGGKKQPGESDADCLIRELYEEMNIIIEVKDHFFTNTHSYDKSTIVLKAYFAIHREGTFLQYEHKTIEWLMKEELAQLDWAPADLPIVKKLLEHLS